jgi:hypothetical protein
MRKNIEQLNPILKGMKYTQLSIVIVLVLALVTMTTTTVAQVYAQGPPGGGPPGKGGPGGPPGKGGPGGPPGGKSHETGCFYFKERFHTLQVCTTVRVMR